MVTYLPPGSNMAEGIPPVRDYLFVLAVDGSSFRMRSDLA